MQRLSSLQASFVRLFGRVLSPGGTRASLLILIYHRVPSRHDPMNADEPDAATFAAQVELLRDVFHPLTLREAAERLARGALPPRAACITFDDGYENNHSVAARILAERGVPATFFVTTSYLGGGRMWNDTVIEAVRHAREVLDLTALGLGSHVLGDERARAALAGQLLRKLKYLPPPERLERVAAIAAAVGTSLPDDLMMTEGQVRELAQLGMEVGAHSVTHPILANVDDVTARREIEESKAKLEAITGEAVTSFAYPNGLPGRDYGSTHVRMARDAGFRAAVSTAWGCARAGSDLFQLPRVSPWDRTPGRYALRLVRTYVQARPASV